MQGPAGAQGPAGPAGGTSLPKIVLVTKSKGLDQEPHKTVEARCPARYDAVSGSVVGSPNKVPGTAKILYYLLEENKPIITGGIGTPRRQIGWRAKSHSGWFAEKVHTAGDAYRLFKIIGGKWKLSVTVSCVLTGVRRATAAP